MSEKDGKPAAESKAGITEAEHKTGVDAAVTAARAEERARISAVADSEAGKARPAEALKLLGRASMSAEDIVAALDITKPDTAAASYEAGRLAAGGLAKPAPAPKAQGHSLNSGSIYAARREQGRKE